MPDTQSGQVSSRIIGNVLMNWFAFATTLLVGFLMSPFLVRHLGDAVYGVWVLVGSLAGYLGLLDFGVTPSTIKYVAEHRARGDQDAMNRVITGGLAIFSVAGVASLAAGLILAFSFNHFFKSTLSDRTVTAVVILAAVNLAITFPASVFVGVVRGYQRYDVDAAITSANIIVKSGVIVWLISRGEGILALSAVTFVFDMIRLAYLARYVRSLNPAIRIRFGFLDKGELSRLFGFSFYAFVIIVGRQLIFFTDSIVIGLFLTTALVTLYFVSSRLVMYMRTLVSEMVGVLMPTTSDLGARDDQEGIRELLVVSTRYMLVIALPVAAVFFILGKTFIGLWMGPEYTSSAPVLYVLTVAMLAHFMEMPAHTVLLGLCKHRVVALFTIIQAVANLAMSVALVRVMGIVGVAVGTALPMVVFTVVSLVVYFRWFLKLSLVDYLRRSGLSALLIQAAFVAPILIIRAFLPPPSLAAFFLELSLALLPYLGIAWLVCVTRAERQAFLKAIGKFAVGLKPRIS